MFAEPLPYLSVRVVLHFGHSNPRNTYSITGTAIEAKDCTRDLGVITSDNVSPTQHVTNVAKRAHVVLSQMKRTVTFRDSKVFTGLYRTYVRPLLEFSVQSWNPSKVSDVNTLEKVQRRALRMITDQGDASYEEKLKRIGLTTLEARRERGDLLEAFKLINDHNGLDKYEYFEFVQNRHSIETRNYTDNLLVPEKCRTNLRKNYFSSRVVNAWNSLPMHIRNSSSINSFKNNYDAYMLQVN